MRVAAGTALAAGLLTLSLSAACAHVRAKDRSGPAKLDHVSPQVRAEYLRRATLWRATRIPEMDLFQGPMRLAATRPGVAGSP